MTTLGPDIRIPKATGTHGDIFAAVGLADLLATISENGPPFIQESTNDFVVILPKSVDEVGLAKIPKVPGYPYLKPDANAPVPAGAIDVVDYKAEKAKADRRKKLKEAAPKGKRRVLDAETQQLIQEEQPRDDWRLLQVLNTLKGLDTTDKLHQQIVGKTVNDFRSEVIAALKALARGDATDIQWDVSLVQLFTPLAAKGYSRLKPDSTGRNDKTKEQWADPFLEWLKYRGYFAVACPFFQGTKAEHIRLLCPVPGNISLGALKSLAKELPKKGVYGSAPKLDALAVLRLAELLVKHSEEYHTAENDILPALRIAGKSPADLISGVSVTFYQSMGRARVVSEISSLSLPGWFPINSSDDAQCWLDILDEHEKAIRGLQDDHSDEIGLLVSYRRFLERRGETAVWALVEFMEQYGPFVVRANGSRQDNRIRWVTRFTDIYLRRIIMGTNPSLLPVVDDPGFEAIARAVRQSTVTAQNKKARGEKIWREVRYELLHDLHRTRTAPGNAFVETVSEFVSRYNYENARHRESTGDIKSAPANVSDDEFRSFVVLVDQFGASTVGALLAAYGSCKEKWEKDEPTTDKDPATTPATQVKS